MSDKDYSPHECWCDTQNEISDRCNCMVSSYIEKIDEMRERIERLEAALKYFKPILEGYLNLSSEVPEGLSPEFYHTLGYASEVEMVETARRHLKALEGEKK